MESIRGSLKLTDDEVSGLMLRDGLWHNESEGYELWLVGRLLMARPVKFEHVHDLPLSRINFGMRLEEQCPRCDAGEEDLLHVLVKCEFSRLVWALLIFHDG
ncbi:hypothetical protein Salat_1196500 [Sesamum alatum]|uniref:Reverse transcriptase zinc-binding domain-containing protein n=1 Tax=Sesamum alatum TaxID=300844 RepID=A0AAE1YEU7_9LAMI|nr:hypothetical protein Salat_1196500 [Sesamum alatum]